MNASTRVRFATGIVAVLIAGCGGKGEPGAAVEPAASASTAAPVSEDKVVNVYNWVDYIEPTMLEKFTAETGIKINYDTYDTNELLETKLLAGSTGYDVVVPSNTFLERQIKAGVFQELDRSRIPNWKNLDPQIVERVAMNDPGNRYAVNYMWGTNGIGYDEAKVKAIMPDAPVDSWKLVFDPAVASKFKDCGIALLDSPTDVVPLVLIYLGKDPNSESESDLKLAEDMLLAVRPFIRMINSSTYTDALANGDICIAVAWSGTLLQARDRAAAVGHGRVIKYSIPKEGTISWFDMLAIPKDAPHPGNAHAFIDFLQRPEVAAANSNFLNYASGNSAALPFVADSTRNDPAIYPSAEVRSRIQVDTVESEPYSRILNRTWTRFVANK